jgi:beta-glucanase (GH16 family)
MKKRRSLKNLLVAALVTALALSMVFVEKAPASSRNNKGGNGGGGGSGSGQTSSTAWQDDFSRSKLNSSFWVVGQGPAPGYIAGQHQGLYDPTHVKIVKDGSNSYLQLLLTQEQGTVDTNPDGVISRGAEIYTKGLYGYGTYAIRMRMSSTASTPNDPQGNSTSGSVSAGFSYINNSQTEIDFEFSGAYPDTLYMVNWLNTDPGADPTPAEETYTTQYPLTVSTQFHTYQFVWQPGMITYYVDGTWQATHTTNIPSAPAEFRINHWGTDNPTGWGGAATLGISRYLYVDWVSYAPLP